MEVMDVPLEIWLDFGLSIMELVMMHVFTTLTL